MKRSGTAVDEVVLLPDSVDFAAAGAGENPLSFDHIVLEEAFKDLPVGELQFAPSALEVVLELACVTHGLP
jgi:hypothetical protein